MIAHIQLDFGSKADALRTHAAITPDNYPLPPGLEIESSVNHNSLIIIIRSERSVDSFGATVEDLMSAIDLSMRTSESIDIDEH